MPVGEVGGADVLVREKILDRASGDGGTPWAEMLSGTGRTSGAGSADHAAASEQESCGEKRRDLAVH